MSSRTFVCWVCRTATRADVYRLDGDPRCASCRRTLTRLSEKTRVPPKDDPRAWAELQESLRVRAEGVAERLQISRVRAIHAVEQKIEILESRPEDRGRRRAIRELRVQLARLRGTTTEINA